MKEPKFKMNLIEFNEFRDTYAEIHGKGYKILVPQEMGVEGYGILAAVQVEKRIFEEDGSILLTKIGFLTTDKRRFVLSNVVYWAFDEIIRDRQGNIEQAKIKITTRDKTVDPTNGECIHIYKTFTLMVRR
jgi:hypothetical protein